MLVDLWIMGQGASKSVKMKDNYASSKFRNFYWLLMKFAFIFRNLFGDGTKTFFDANVGQNYYFP